MINAFRVTAASLAVAALSACSGIGDGSRPESLTVLESSDLSSRGGEDAIALAPGSGFALTCVTKQLEAVVRFDDGQVGSFTSRAVWSSDDESVVGVTNFLDTPLPGDPDLFLPAGLLLPISAGTATITAEFAGLSHSFEVHVEASDPGSYVLTGVERTMSPASTSVLGAEIGDGGETRSVTTNSTFVLDNPTPEIEDLVDLTTGGSLTIPPVDGTVLTMPQYFTIRATPRVPDASCQALAPTVQVRIDYPTSVEVGYEPDFYGPGAAPNENRLVAGFSQALQLIANFPDRGDGTPLTQDVSDDFAAAYQVQPDAATDCSGAFDEDSTETPAESVVFGNALLRLGNLAIGVTEGDALVCARFGSIRTDTDEYLEDPMALSLAVVPSVEDDTAPTTLDSLTITPAAATLDDLNEIVDYTVMADFTLADTTTLTQVATRDVFWTVDSDFSTGEERRLAEITNLGSSLVAGRAVSVRPLGEVPTPLVVNVNANVVFGDELDDPEQPPVDDFRASVPLTVSVPDAP